MAKIRIHELAKEFKMTSKNMVNILINMGIEVKNHMSTLEESQANWIRKQLADKSETENSHAANKEKNINNGNSNQTVTAKNIEKSPSPKQLKQNEKTWHSHNKSSEKRADSNTNNNRSNNKENTKHMRIPNNIPNKSYNNSDKEKTKPIPRDHRLNKESGEQNDRNVNAKNEGQNLRSGRTESNSNRIKEAPTQKVENKKVLPFTQGGNKRNKVAFDNIKNDYSKPQRKSKHKKKKEEQEPKMPEKISIADTIIVRELAELLNKSSAEIVKKLMELGLMATINQPIEFDTAEILASMYGVEVEREISREEQILEEIVDSEESLQFRPPIVTVMGHVDHGKTSLLDRIRRADVASGEAGGITQHIGAYQVKINGSPITFIDTPGHEAFTAMRARGANLTDIVVLVVAADDGVKPQTVEAINHIKAAKVPFIVAINKIDKPDVNPERVKQQLTEYNIVPEEWGGDTVFVPVSAKTGAGIDTLLEMILLVAEIHELKANPNRPAEGVIIEGRLDKGRGPVATVLVQKGTLRIGDCLVSGLNWCKVRAMSDDKGRRTDKVLPSTPVEITGWSAVPEAGEKVQVCEEKVAKELTALRINEKKIEEQKKSSRVSLDDFFKQMQDHGIKELNLIIKGDVQGSVEALSQSLIKLSTDEVKVVVVHSAVGAIKETDVMLASASNAIIIGFNVRPDVKARQHAEEENIDIRLYRVIYEAIEDVKKAMAGLLDPEYKEKYLGRAEVRKVIKVPNVGSVAGSYVIEGKMQRNANIRLLREGVIVYEGYLSSLKRFKDDAKEVLENYECGIGIKDFNDIKEGDIIEAYVMEEVPREL